MPMAARWNDAVITGHGCTPVTALNWPGQASVFANALMMARMGDPTYPHTIGIPPICPPHIAVINKGNPTVLVVGKPQGFLGCSADLGAVSSGSPTVLIGGPGGGGSQKAADGSRNALGQQAGGGARPGFAP